MEGAGAELLSPRVFKKELAPVLFINEKLIKMIQ